MGSWPAALASPVPRGALIFVAALMIRWLHLILLYASHPEIVDWPILDAGHYHAWAQDIMAGTGLSRRVFFMHPVYPHLLAALYLVTGPSPLAAAIVQSVFGAAGVVLFHELCRRWFDARTALVAALILALYRPLVINASLLETVELGIFLMLLSLWLCETAEGPRAWLRLGLAGMAFVLAALCRGNLMLAAPALLLARVSLVSGAWPARLRSALPIALGIALAMTVVGARNRIVGGEWVWLTASPGQTFYLGNYRDATTGAHQPPPFLRADPKYEEADYHAEAERLAGRPLTKKEASSLWLRKGIEDVAADPAFAAVRFVRKLGLTFGAYEIADNYNLAYLARLTALGWLPMPNFLLIVGLAALGAGLAWRDRRRLALLFGTAALYALSLGVFYLSSRLRIYLVPFLVAFAAHGALWTIQAARASRYRTVVLALVGVAAVMAVSATITPAHVRRHERSQALSSHGISLAKAGQETKARALRDSALALDPQNEFLLVNAGLFALREGDPRRAVEACRRAAAVRPNLATAHGCLGIALSRVGAHREAEAALRRAAAIDRDGPESRYNLAVLLAQTGRRQEARRLFEDILAVWPSHAGARAGLALTR